MGAAPDRQTVSTLIRAIDGCTTADGERLRERLSDGCWPGGAEDRTEPGARRWLRRWRAARGAPLTMRCTCASGCCPACN